MKAFVDTNVLLDVLAERKPFFDDSIAVWTLAEQRRIEGLISAISFNNVYFVINRLSGRQDARKAIQLLRNSFITVACDAQVLQEAIDAEFDDFEDANQYVSALRAEADCVVTRNAAHFPKSNDCPILTPGEFLSAHSRTDPDARE